MNISSIDVTATVLADIFMTELETTDNIRAKTKRASKG